MKRGAVKMTAAFAALAAWAAISCEGPIEPPPQGPIPWERYEVRGLPGGWPVNDVYMLSPSEGWAVAEGPYFLYFDGAEWAVHTAFTAKYPDVDVMRLGFSTPDDGWAIGHKFISSWRCEGYVFHYDGEGWASITDIPTELEYRYPALYDVEALAPDDVWFTAGRSILHYDGETWLEYALRSEVFGLSFSDPKHGWAVGGSHFYRWTGTAWEQVDNETHYGVLDVASPGPRAAWAVGGFPSLGEIPPEYEISRWDETKGEWAYYRGGRFKDPYFCLERVRFASPDDGWAVARNKVISYDGNDWREETTPGGLYSVFTLGGDDVWVGSRGCLYKYSRLED